jgi:hypothetical protein
MVGRDGSAARRDPEANTGVFYEAAVVSCLVALMVLGFLGSQPRE